MMVDDELPRAKDETVWDKAKDQQNLIFAFFGGLIVSWVFNGAQGENTGWLMVGTVVAFYFLARRTKRSLPTLVDVVLEIADDQKRLGNDLDFDPKCITVLQLKKDKYVIGFKGHGSFIWEGRLAKGSRAMIPQTAEAVRMDYVNRNIELGLAFDEDTKKR